MPMKGTRKFFFRKSAQEKYAKETPRKSVQNYCFVHEDSVSNGKVDARIRECDGRKRSMTQTKVATKDLITPKAYTWHESCRNGGACPMKDSGGWDSNPRKSSSTRVSKPKVVKTKTTKAKTTKAKTTKTKATKVAPKKTTSKKRK